MKIVHAVSLAVVLGCGVSLSAVADQRVVQQQPIMSQPQQAAPAATTAASATKERSLHHHRHHHATAHENDNLEYERKMARENGDPNWDRDSRHAYNKHWGGERHYHAHHYHHHHVNNLPATASGKTWEWHHNQAHMDRKVMGDH